MAETETVVWTVVIAKNLKNDFILHVIRHEYRQTVESHRTSNAGDTCTRNLYKKLACLS